MKRIVLAYSGGLDTSVAIPWLKARYGTLDNLNTRWTTAYWSETLFAWEQIPIQTQYGNPGLLLSWKRFVSDTWRSYQKNQLEVIRANSDPKQFITTNTMGWYDGFDHYIVEKDLDLAAWDAGGTGSTRSAAAGATFLTVHAHDAKALRAAVAGKAGLAERLVEFDRADLHWVIVLRVV